LPSQNQLHAILGDTALHSFSSLRLAARQHAVDHFSYPVIAKQFIAAYQYAIKMRS
jgi:7-cyano-7-deazaguanine synthase in queuosine biosynthesis